MADINILRNSIFKEPLQKGLFLSLVLISLQPLLDVLAQPYNPKKRYDFTLIGWTNLSDRIFIAKYLGFEFDPPGIEKTREVMFSTCFPRAMAPVRSKYSLIKPLKGASCSSNFEVKSEYLVEYHDTTGTIVKPVIEPRKGTCWILFLKDNSKSNNKRIFEPVVQDDTFGAELTDANLKLIINEIAHPSVKAKKRI